VRRALDLVRRRGCSPDEIAWKLNSAHSIAPDVA
jgi:hypothetical protein